ncbi:LWR-salt protein [Natronorarus salvus]|uniref:LWR-salt protein n=1 Tax=Natronorarus salvus TaxID=3117733 RepID=UPI002F261086
MASYVFHVRFRLDPDGMRAEPSEFETTLVREADPPGTEGWLFFRDRLWRGEIGDERHMREFAEEVLGVRVERVEFHRFEVTGEELATLEAEIERDLEPFRATSATEVLHKYFGSSLEVR